MPVEIAAASYSGGRGALRSFRRIARCLDRTRGGAALDAAGRASNDEALGAGMENSVSVREDFSTLATRGVREGRIARARGAARDDNPYRAATSGPIVGFGSLGQARLK